jgi:ABC-2 type transport system ATP-binding protein
MPALEVRSVSKSFGEFKAVDSVSFSIEAGEVYGFIGPNGAGKTTTMRIIATLALPDEGDVLVEGSSVLSDPRAARDRLGFMPDSYGAYSSTTITEYLDFFARAYGLRGERRRRALSEVMGFTGLDTLQGKLTSALSKGMKQRLCLAKTLLHDPSTLVLDEPAAGLDPRARVEFRELVKALAEMGKAVLISSHILSELSEMCDGVAVIEAGRIQATGSVESVIKGVRPHAEVLLRVLGDLEAAHRALLERPGVANVRPDRGGLLFDFEGEPDALAELLEALVRSGLRPVEFSLEETDLEDVFLKLTEGIVQ